MEDENQPMMDEWTESHLNSFIKRVVPQQYQQNFRRYAVRHWEYDPVYWNAKGWDQMFQRFLSASPKDW
jgi:hypothetical protein